MKRLFEDLFFFRQEYKVRTKEDLHIELFIVRGGDTNGKTNSGNGRKT
jgi:hypothetical protein